MREAPQPLEKVVVTATRPAAADVDGPDELRTYDQAEVENAGAFNLQEFIDQLPRGADGDTLVLIDGMPAYLDLASLSPAMVAAIEVSYSGSMPAYGAYAKGRVINIRLKQDYDGREFALRFSGSLHADGWRRDLSFTGGNFRGPWRLFYGMQYARNDGVTADARDFSRDQDRRAQGGRDYRVPWGEVPVVQAATGSLNGVTDAAGNPVRVALVPANAPGPLTPAAFLPGTSAAAAGQRFFNTSPYLYLANPAESVGGNFRVLRAIGKLQLSVAASFNSQRSRRNGPPPVTPASAETRVPAAFNPFGQDVLVGLVHTGFGPVVQDSSNDRGQLSLLANWVGSVWRGTAILTHSNSEQQRDSRDLDAAAFTAALAAEDPAARFNPFVGQGSTANATLYPALAVHRTEDTENKNTQFNARANGPVGEGFGAGPIQLSLVGNGNWRDNERTVRNQRGLADAMTRDSSGTIRFTTNAEIPLLKDRAWLYRLDGSLSGSYSRNTGGGDSRRYRTGLSWSPTRSWVFRANFSQTASTPGDHSDDDPESRVETLVDPRREPAAVENVLVFSNPVTSTQPSHGDDLHLAATFQPISRPGWIFRLSYRQERNSQATGSPFRAQDVIDNETLFAGRVVRDAQSISDLVLGQPGRILAVDTTPSAVANQEQRQLDFGLEFQFPSRPDRPGGRGSGQGGGRGGDGQGSGRGTSRSGGGGNVAGGRQGTQLPGRNANRDLVRVNDRVTVSLDLEYPFESRYEVAAGQVFVSREDGPANQPDWSLQAQVRWQHRQWNYFVDFRHTAASRLRTIPAFSTTSLNVNYRFAQPVWRKFGKGLQLGARLQNLGLNQPPYADTILGYRGGAALGTTVALLAQLPL